MNDHPEHDHDHLSHTEEPDPAALASFERRHAPGNGEAPVEAVEATYEIPAPPTPEEAERKAAARQCLTAFLVVIEDDGSAWATNNIDLVLDPKRPPNMGDMYRASAEVMKDIASMEQTQRTVQMLAQVWPQIAAGQAEAERQQKLAAKLASKGIHVPGR